MTNNRCASCAHWEYADIYAPGWESLPLTHLYAYGECALLSSPQSVPPVRSVPDDGDPIDTHWTFGCILHESAKPIPHEPRVPDAE